MAWDRLMNLLTRLILLRYNGGILMMVTSPLTFGWSCIVLLLAPSVTKDNLNTGKTCFFLLLQACISKTCSWTDLICKICFSSTWLTKQIILLNAPRGSLTELESVTFTHQGPSFFQTAPCHNLQENQSFLWHPERGWGQQKGGIQTPSHSSLPSFAAS